MTLYSWLATHIKSFANWISSKLKFLLRAKPKRNMADFDESWQPFLDSCAKGLAGPELARGISQGLHLIAYQPGADPSESILSLPLQLAVASGETEAIELLVAAGVDIEEACYMRRYEEHMSPLALASKMNLSSAAKLLLRLGASPNGRRGEGITPLKMASYSGRPDMVKILFSAGALVRKDPQFGALGALGALSWCSLGEGLPAHEECLLLMLEAGADAKEAREDGTSALMWAADKGWLAGVEILISHGADPLAVRDDGANAFMWACRNHKKDFRVAKSIVDACGRIPFSTNKDGRGILFYAAHGGIPECVALALSAGCSVHEQSALGQSPLHFAIISDSRACVEMLLAAGANPNAPGALGPVDTPLNDASRSRAELFEALILAGGNPFIEPTQPDQQRFKSSFRNACEAGFKDALLMALDRGLAPMIANGGGPRLVEVAAEHNSSISEAIRAVLLSRDEQLLLGAECRSGSSTRPLRI